MEIHLPKQKQGVAYVNKLTCCGSRIILVERLHNIIPNLDNFL